MSKGAFLTAATIWLALAGYVAGAVLILLSIQRSHLRLNARLAWTIGCAFFLAHVFCAFNYYYDWSHQTAYLETERQTIEVMGSGQGNGVYVSYLFTLVWLADVIWWWLAPLSHRQRPRILTFILHAFMLFIIFNGTVIFKAGLSRVLGLSFFVLLFCVWLITRKSKGKTLVEIGERIS